VGLSTLPTSDEAPPAYLTNFLRGKFKAFELATQALRSLVARAPPSEPALQIAYTLLVYCVAPD